MAGEPENGERAALEDRLRIYGMIIERYREPIENGERRSITALRERISPYSEFIVKLRDRLLSSFQDYSYEKDFGIASIVAVNYIKGIRNVTLPVSFWINFDEIDRSGAGDVMDKALLLASLLRAFGSQSAKLIITSKGSAYVSYEWDGKAYVVKPESGSVLDENDANAIFASDPKTYAFSDLYFETYGE
jgi:hypothetical protein